MSKYRSFFSYVIPSVLAFALSGIYVIVDGFFVGNSIGDVGLSTINISYPVVALMQAAGTGIGMGGAVLYSIAKAQRDDKRAETYAGVTMVLLLSVSVVLTAALYGALKWVLIFLGAEGEILKLGQEYLRIIVLGGIFQLLATGVVPIIRNCGGATFAMFSMVAGFLTNIALDYAFVWIFQWGVGGAAFATIIGQAVTMVAGAVYLHKKKLLSFKLPKEHARNIVLRITKIGLAPFGLTLSPILSLILMNRYSMQYAGEQAVACYACIAYATTIVYTLLQGVGDGSQPLLSKCYGEGLLHEMKHIRKLAYLSAGTLAGACMILLYILRYDIGRLFGASGAVIDLTGDEMPIFLLGFLFLAFTRVTTSSFYATEQNLFSYVLVYAEPVLLFVMLLVIPVFLGQTGVWWSMCIAQIATAVIAALLKRHWDNRSLTGKIPVNC